jgi:tetratricopeptide (TPR) repeat protein
VRLKNIWPIPALGLGGALLVGGLVVAFMGRPKPPADIPLEEAKALVQDKRYQEAIEKLNSKEVRNYLDYGNPDDAHMRAFHLARARAFAGAQATLGLSRPENHRVIVEDFEAAEMAGEPGADHELEPVDVSLLVESKIALDDVDGALKRIGALGEPEAARKTRLTRMVVDHNLAILTSTDTPEQARSEQTLSLLAALSADPSLSPGDRAWVLARQGDLLLAAKQPEEAINKLIRRVGLLKDVPLEQQGELYVLLGKAYFQSDQPMEAAKQLEAADTLLERSSPLRADLGIMQARLAQSGVAVGAVGAENDPTLLLEFAREKYEAVMTEFGPGPQYSRALLGVAEVEASLRHDDKSLEKYAELVELVNGGARPKAVEHGAGSGEAKPKPADHPASGGEHGAETPKPDEHGAPKPAAENGHAPGGEHPAPAAHAKEATQPHKLVGAGEARRVSRLGGVTRERVLASLMQRFTERFESEQRESALRYASIAESLYKDSETPGEVLAAIGNTRRAMADQLMAQAREAHAAAAAKGAVTPEFRVVDLDPATRAEVKKNYIVAGDYLRRHSKAISATNLSEASKSLWTAADSYDLAGDMDEAKRAFADYAAGASDTDPHKSEAKFRLAQVFQAKKPPEYGAAAALYRELAESIDLRDPTRSAGSIADRAVVPLAQCMLNDNDPANDGEARRMLVDVVDGSRLAPDAAEFREALVELGRAAYHAERFAEAIGWFEQAVKRTKDPRQAVELRYLLADSHRREGVKIGKTLATQRLPQAQVDQLESARQGHLSSARGMYDDVRSDLDAREPRTLSGMERVYLRNAYFYAGDCAMELKSYDGAIAAYDAARNKYADDPSSLVAMAQIVSAYAAQEKWAEARTANERARQQLAKFPESVWQNPDLPMEKRHWERWLDARTLIGQQTVGAEKDEKSER